MLKHMNSNPYKNLTESDAYKKMRPELKVHTNLTRTQIPRFSPPWICHGGKISFHRNSPTCRDLACKWEQISATEGKIKHLSVMQLLSKLIDVQLIHLDLV